MRIETFNSTIFPDWDSNMVITTTPDGIRDIHIDDLYKMVDVYRDCFDTPIEEKISMSDAWVFLKLWAYGCKQKFKTPLILFGVKKCYPSAENPIYLLEAGLFDTLTGHKEKFNDCKLSNGQFTMKCAIRPIEIDIKKPHDNDLSH